MNKEKAQYEKIRDLTLRELRINIIIEKLEDMKPITEHIDDKEVKEIIRKFNQELADLKVLTANRLAVLQ